MRLTEKQLNSAVEAMEEVWDRNSMPVPFEDMARAAYPYLAVWEEPTEEELYRWLGSEIYSRIITDKIIEFVRRKNAALLPVDPQPTKKATMPEIVVPEGMLKAAVDAMKNPSGTKHRSTEQWATIGLEASLRWLIEQLEGMLDSDNKDGYNAALRNVRRMFAPPVDPRREKIIEVLQKSRIAVANAESGDLETVADNILAALKEDHAETIPPRHGH